MTWAAATGRGGDGNVFDTIAGEVADRRADHTRVTGERIEDATRRVKQAVGLLF